MRPRRLPLAVLVIGALALVSTGCTSTSSNAFTVNGHDVSQHSLDDELSVLHDHPLFASALSGKQIAIPLEGSLPAGITAQWLGLRVIASVAGAELARRHGHITAQDRRNAGLDRSSGYRSLPSGFRHTVLEHIAAVRALQRLLGTDLASLQAALHKACPSGRYVSHILVASEDAARALKAQLAAGADFATLARANSTDTGSAQQGGALGCADGQTFAAPFKTVATTQPVGVVSDPVQTQFGWHLILVTNTPSPSDRDAATIAAVVALTRRAHVHVDPRYGRWDRAKSQVLPPPTPAG